MEKRGRRATFTSLRISKLLKMCCFGGGTKCFICSCLTSSLNPLVCTTHTVLTKRVPFATLQAMRRSARALELLLLTVQAEVPDTAATLRLSGMELADCIQEVGALRWVFPWKIHCKESTCPIHLLPCAKFCSVLSRLSCGGFALLLATAPLQH